MRSEDQEISERSANGASRVRSSVNVAAQFRNSGSDLLQTYSLLADDELGKMPEWQLARRVAASKELSKSELMRRFLLYVCEQHLMGNTHEITEQRIGTKIFNRPAGYNPGQDNIVRNYARMLRKRLDDYFEGEGSTEPMRLTIPRGGYVPVFRPIPDEPAVASVGEPLAVAAASPAVDISAEISASSRVSKRWGWLALGIAAGIILFCAGWFLGRVRRPEPPQSVAHPIWATLFERNRNTLIVSADSGLGILENLTRRTVGLEEYANGTYLAEMKTIPGLDVANLNDLRRQRYTSFVNVNITSSLIQLPEFIANRAQIRFARGISTEDLRSSNAILFGSKHTNPWVSLFEKNQNFRLEYTSEVDRSFVMNEHPTGAEQKIYENGPDAEANQTYGTIDYLPSLDGKGHVLIIQGLNMAATQAAADILFDPEAMRSVFAQALLPNGALKSFELLIETRSIGANAPGARIIATRFYPQ